MPNITKPVPFPSSFRSTRNNLLTICTVSASRLARGTAEHLLAREYVARISTGQIDRDRGGHGDHPAFSAARTPPSELEGGARAAARWYLHPNRRMGVGVWIPAPLLTPAEYATELAAIQADADALISEAVFVAAARAPFEDYFDAVAAVETTHPSEPGYAAAYTAYVDAVLALHAAYGI